MFVKKKGFFKTNSIFLRKLYDVHENKAWFESMISGNLNKMWGFYVLQTRIENISVIRTKLGVTSPKNASLATFRSRFGFNITNNSFHCSDSAETANLEIALFHACIFNFILL